MSVVVRSPQTTITVSHKGGTVVVSKPSNDIVVAPSLTVSGALGLVTGANVGGGDAEVFRDKIGTVLNFRTLSGLSGVAVSENGDVVEIDGSSLQTVLLSHADRHQHGGADEVATGTPAANAIPKADGTGKLDSGWMPTGTFTLVAVSAADTTPGFLNDKIVAGAGLTSQILNPAGDEDLQLNIGANVDGSIVVNADDIQVGVLATDAQHGDRGGGSLHDLAIASGAAGFLAGADKQLIDDLPTTYAPLIHASRHAGAGADPITSLGIHTVTGQLQLTGTDNEVFLNATNSNLVRFANVGVGAPTATTRSVGTKILLYDQISPTRTDYAIGLEDGGIWFSVSDITDTRQFTWYAGETPLLYLRGDGLLQFGGQTNTEPALRASGDDLEIMKADTSARSGVICEKLLMDGSQYLTWINRSNINSPVDGVIRFTDTTFADIDMVQWGGGTLAYPAWQRSGATFAARLANDSGYTSVTASDFDLSSGGSLGTHAARHAGAGGDPITTLGAVTFTGVLDFISATVINGLTDSKLLLTDTLGTSFDMIQLGGTAATDVAIKVNTTSPAPCLEARLADDSDSAYFRAQHIGLGTDPTDGHLIFGDEFFAGTGNKVGIGIFPAYIPSSLATQNLYGLQGNVFFGGTNWGAGSFVNALQFYPAPDYLNGAVSWGSSALNLLGISTGGMINIFSRTVTANTIVGMAVQTLAHIFGTPGAVSANSATAIEVTTPSQTTGTIGVQTGIEIQPQLYGTLNQGLWMAGDGAGSDIVIGAGKDVRFYYDGVDLQLDTSIVAASDFVLSCGTGKTLELTETVWEDLRVPLTSGRQGLTNPPSWSQYRDNGAASVGVYTWAFSDQAVAANEEELWFQVQLPHNWKEGTTIKPHIHWGIKTAGAANEFVKWGLEYTWANIDGTIGTTTIITSDASSAATATISGDSTLLINKHYVTDIGDITGTGKTISSMLLCRIFRNSSHADDDLAQDAYGFEVDFHHEIDTMGSRQILVK
jgi:hypothetical protein